MGFVPSRAPLDGQYFDVAIIGGGINGVAIARECARGGRRTLLVEQNDFASGTTSRSTRIIHGGLRYLEHGELGLVRESLRERARLAADYPHLVRPMEFVLAMPRGQYSEWQLRLGLWLYRKYAGAKASPRNGSVSETERLLDCDSLCLFRYDDAQCEFPERLTAEWLRDALRAGAMVRNHTSALGVRTANGKAVGIRLRDQLSGHECEIGATHIMNATGPWADVLCRNSGIETAAPLIGGVRGSHIVLPRFTGAPESAVYTQATDGRPVFLVPWNGQLLFGTTEVRDEGDPGQTRPSESEIAYLVQSLRRMFPRAATVEINFAFAGVRPLPYAEGQEPSAVTRRCFLHDHASEGAAGMITIVGGKLTTAASLARKCARKIGIATAEPRSVAFADASAFDVLLARFTNEVMATADVDDMAAHALVTWHGGESIGIARAIAGDRRLASPIADGTNHVLAEAVLAVEEEEAVTLADILLRRVPVAFGRDWCEDATRQAAQRIGETLRWSEQQIRSQVERFEEERSAFLVRPATLQLSA